MHFQLGRYLRDRYECILGPDYSPDKIYIRSTNTERTLESAKYNTAGIFAPWSVKSWRNALNYAPVKIHTVPVHEDYLLFQKSPCKRADQLRQHVIESDQAILNEYPALISYLEKHSGSFKTVDDFYSLYDSLRIEKMARLP